jgi:hypothetical protein
MDVLSGNASLESHVRRKLSCVVWRGGVGKASRCCVPQLSMQRDGSLAPYPTSRPVFGGAEGEISSVYSTPQNQSVFPLLEEVTFRRILIFKSSSNSGHFSGALLLFCYITFVGIRHIYGWSAHRRTVP